MILFIVVLHGLYLHFSILFLTFLGCLFIFFYKELLVGFLFPLPKICGNRLALVNGVYVRHMMRLADSRKD